MSAAPQRTILVVDDDADVRLALARVLEKEGYTVHLARDGEEGLRTLQACNAQLVISDYDMPDMNGVDFLKAVRKRKPHACRIMLTALIERDIVIRSINEAEVYRFLQKPWDDAMLKATLHVAFEALLLEEENRRLVAALRRQLRTVRELEQKFPGSVDAGADAEAAVLVAEADLLKVDEE